jgi:hypothetical protein
MMDASGVLGRCAILLRPIHLRPPILSRRFSVTTRRISNETVMLTIASLLSILFFTFHLTDDIVRGMEPGTLSSLLPIGSFAVRNAGAGRKAIGVRDHPPRRSLGCVVHMKGAGVGGAIAKSSGAFFFIWTLLALGVTALFSVILSARGLWEHSPWRTAAQHKQGARA